MDNTQQRIFLTVTLDPRIWSAKSQYLQFQESQHILHKYLRLFSSDYTAFPELTKKGHIHWHVMYDESDKIKRFRSLKKMVDELGFCDFQIPKDLVATIAYCQKDKDTMEQVLQTHLPLTYNILEDVLSFNKRQERNRRRDIKYPAEATKSGPLDRYMTQEEIFDTLMEQHIKK